MAGKRIDNPRYALVTIRFTDGEKMCLKIKAIRHVKSLAKYIREQILQQRGEGSA